MTFAQKRQHERFPIALDVAYVVSGERVAAQSRDLSLGGMFIVSDRVLPYGTQFELEVKLPDLPAPSKFDATVRWSGPDGMGVQWGTLRAKESWAINQILSRR